MKTKRLAIGICNHHKRNDLVRFAWRVNRDVTLGCLKWQISTQTLLLPVQYRRFGYAKKYWDTYHISEYLFNTIARMCAERWPYVSS